MDNFYQGKNPLIFYFLLWLIRQGETLVQRGSEKRGAGRDQRRSQRSNTVHRQPWTPYAAAGSPPRHWFSKSASFLVSDRTGGAAPGTGWWEAESSVRKTGGQLGLPGINILFLKFLWGLNGRKEGWGSFWNVCKFLRMGKSPSNPYFKKWLLALLFGAAAAEMIRAVSHFSDSGLQNCLHNLRPFSPSPTHPHLPRLLPLLLTAWGGHVGWVRDQDKLPLPHIQAHLSCGDICRGGE